MIEFLDCTMQAPWTKLETLVREERILARRRRKVILGSNSKAPQRSAIRKRGETSSNGDEQEPRVRQII